MVIWFNSGLSLAAWMRPVLMFAAPLVLLIAVLSFFISPWAAQNAEQYRSKLETRDDLSRVEPGVFGESRGRRACSSSSRWPATRIRCRTCS